MLYSIETTNKKNGISFMVSNGLKPKAPLLGFNCILLRLICFFIFGISIFAFGLLNAQGTVHATASVTITINDGLATLDLVAADGEIAYGESDTASFSVSTTGGGGYTATVIGNNVNGRLEGVDSSNYFSSIVSPTTLPQDFSNGTWGFKPSTYNGINNFDFQPVATSETPAIIDVTNSAMTGDYTLSVAAKTDMDTVADNYSYSFVVAATANGTDYTISYVDATANMPNPTTKTTSSGDSITLDSNIPLKAGYEFAGWCTIKTIHLLDTSCNGGTVYQPGDTYTLGSATNVDLYAMWKEATTFEQAYAAAGKSKTSGYYRMDDMSSNICNSVTTEQVATLIDDRGTSGIQTYNIAKLRDGKCWMTQNLRLTYGTNSIVASDGVGGTISWTPERATNADWVDDENNPYSYSEGDMTDGVYYNWAAAIASNDSSGRTSGDASTSICPKGWKLPRNSGSTDSWYGLYQKYNNYSLMRGAPVELDLSGFKLASGLYSHGSHGYYWSSYTGDSTAAYVLHIQSSTVYPSERYSRIHGFSVRCISI